MVRKAVIFLAILAVACTMVSAQVPDGKFTVFTGKGQSSSIDEIMKSLENTDVVFLGELHDDAIAHAIQLEIFKRAIEQYGAKRRVTLSLEMFERDVQTVVNEYLAGLISEQHFLLSSRPWPRYKEDYRPLVELAKGKKLDVVAANAPRRYVNMVSRNGRDAVNSLSKEAKTWLAPLPYAEPSEAYSKKFKALMGSSMEASSMGIDKILSSQSLWDATMAHSVAQSLKKNKGSLVVHLNGGFHTEKRLGTVEHFLKYRKNGRAIVVTIRYEDEFKKFDVAKHTDLGDFVILTQRQPRGVINQILQRMTNYAKDLKTLKGNITIAQYNGQLMTLDTIDGAFMYLPPSETRTASIRADLSSHSKEHLAIVNGKFALHKPRISMMYVGKIREDREGSLERAFGLLKNSQQELRSAFNISYLGEPTLPDGAKTLHLKLVPKAATKAGYKSIQAWVDADGMVRQISFDEHNGDKTTIRFSGLQRNVTLPGEAFVIKPPPGTRVVNF